MKNNITKVLALCLLLAMLVGMAVPGQAAAKPSIVRSTLWAGVGRSALIVLNLPADAKSFTVTSSDKAVVRGGCYDKNDPSSLWIEPLKVGKAKITVRYKTGGKTKSVSATFTVKKYPNPFAWVKVNGKKVNLKKNKLGYDCNNYRKDTITVDYKVSSGWKLKSRTVAKYKGYDIENDTWKKNKAISLTGCDGAIIFIILENKAGDEFTYMVFMNR